MQSLRAMLKSFLNLLTVYDYLAFGALFAFCVLLVLLGIMLRRLTFLSFVMTFLGFGALIVGPFFSYDFIRQTIYKSQIQVVKFKQLKFTKALVIDVRVANLSHKDFTRCNLTLSVYKKTDDNSSFIERIRALRPLRKKRMVLEKNITAGLKSDVKIILEPFRYTKAFDIDLSGSCLDKK